MFFLSAGTFTVNFIRYLCEWQIACSFYQKTIWMDVKFLDCSVFRNRIRTEFWFSAHPYLPVKLYACYWRSTTCI